MLSRYLKQDHELEIHDRYALLNLDRTVRHEIFMIDSFQKIGMPEPFPEEGEELKVSQNLRHAIEKKFQE